MSYGPFGSVIVEFLTELPSMENELDALLASADAESQQLAAELEGTPTFDLHCFTGQSLKGTCYSMFFCDIIVLVMLIEGK